MIISCYQSFCLWVLQQAKNILIYVLHLITISVRQRKFRAPFSTCLSEKYLLCCPDFRLACPFANSHHAARSCAFRQRHFTNRRHLRSVFCFVMCRGVWVRSESVPLRKTLTSAHAVQTSCGARIHPCIAKQYFSRKPDKFQVRWNFSLPDKFCFLDAKLNKLWLPAAKSHGFDW